MPRTWTPQDIQETVRNYQVACVIMAGAELDVFTHLTRGPRSAGQLAQATGSDLRGMTILLDALAAVDLLAKRGEFYGLAPNVGDTLTARGAHTHLAMTRHQATCLRRWSRLADTIKSGQPTPVPPSILGEAGDKASFIEAMNDISGPVAEQLVREINVVPCTHLLDVGGASGTYTIAFLKANPDARATLFDLPHVIPMAQQRLAAEGLAARVQLVSGDFTRDELPRGADYAWVSAIIHQQSRPENVELYRKIARALTPGGHIGIRDIVMDETHTQPAGGALFAVNMLSATATGGTFSLSEIRADLETAGFTDVRQIRSDAWMNAVVVARK